MKETDINKWTTLMIARMEQMKASDWKKGWIGGTSGFAGLPQNVGDRNYSGSNSFFLQLQTAAQGYRLPVYLTFKQAHNLKAHVLKGEKAFPVVYWDVLVKDKNGHKVSSDEYKAMSKEEKKGMDVIPFFKAFPVYNIDQTNLAEVQPERVQKLMEKFKVPELRDKEGMYAHAALDRMIETQGWLCPIQANKREDGAYYSPTRDIVVLPMKEQFNIGNTPEEIYRGGMEFYSTMLHEMTHSTMTPERLNREMGGRFGDPKYAKEELVAELTAAMISHSMGFDSKVTDNSAAYLDSWIGVLKQEPKFIVSIMADVNKASDLILDQVDKQRLALNEQPYLTKNDPFAPLGEGEEVPFKNAAIVKTRNGDYAIRASYDGVELGLKKVSKDTAKTYFQLTDYKDKAAFLNMTAHKTFEPEIANLKRTQAVGAKLSI
ncbi:DUF1738 domain-containing protein [Bacteroides caccae]|uniref:DUF1738 domain-containing protein n=1 Tax=Bacteroides caccae TaxID=47678 RepID=A0A6L3KSW7_9BACE|nr:ArdC-like ssDNA-binding domain-containing protein [Bacteroides caccae]KAA5445053.1 DUF1738 domain-containing protein [Bacteroides caccae]KAA5463494.1 DUF1738 domain-containing protein [Bacteroides caccae]